MRKRVRFRLLLAVMALFLTVSQAPAAYQPVAVLRHPFASEHIGPQGIVVRDGLVRHKRLVATLYRTGMTDCLTVEATTNDSGSCTLLFDRWPNIGSPVEPGSVERLELSLPGTYRATRAGSGFSFEPLRIERISASGKSGETLEVLLPLSVSVHDTTIGTGPFEFDFVVLTDPHIASGKKVDERGWGDFGSEGWNDSDTGLTERPWPIERIEACVAFINSELVGQPGCDARFVAVTGDFTNYSERSEYQRARHVFSALDARLFLVPLPGNHDGWPFVGIIPVPPWGPYGEFDEQDPSEVCIGEFFVDAFRGVYDTLRSVKPVPNWQSDVHLLTPAPSESTCHEWPSYYANFGFSYQGTRFIATDFTTRAHAPRVPFGGWPGLNYDPDTYSGGAYHWTLDWLKSQVDAVQDGERMVCLGHHAYMHKESLGVDIYFSAEEIADIRNCGVRNNKPIVTSIGGHLEFDCRGRQRLGDDTICDFFVLDDAQYENVYVFRVCDSVRLQVTHSDPGPTLSRTVSFTADYDYQGESNEPSHYYWNFGDGSHADGADLSSPSHVYLNPVRDTVYKVSVKVVTGSGRPVWASDTVHVQHAEGGWAELTPMPADPSRKAIKDGGCMAYDVSRDLIYASKGNKAVTQSGLSDFYKYDVNANNWTPLAGIPLGAEGKAPYKGSVMCSDGVGSVFLTKGNNTRGFWRYWAASNRWDSLASVPLGSSNKKVKQGASLAWAPHGGAGSDTGFLYLLKGYRNEFYRYDPRNNSWDTLTDAPVGPSNRRKWDAGSWIVADPRPDSHKVYAFKAKYHEFYVYDTDADTWSGPKTPMPIPGSAKGKKAKDGSCAVWYDGTIYAFKGGNTQEFWRYFPELDSWAEHETIPSVGSTGTRKRVKAGGALAAHPSMGVLAFKGNNTREMWRFVPVQVPGLVAWRGAAGGSAVTGGPTLGGELPLMDGLEASKPRWNWQGTMVCYSKTDTLTEREQIYQCQYGWSGPEQRVVDMDEDCEEPVYSPDGEYIAFQLDDTVSGFYQLCVTPSFDTGIGGGVLHGRGAATEVPVCHTVATGNASAIAPSAGMVSQVPVAQSAAAGRRMVCAGPGTSGSPTSLGLVWQITYAEADHCYPEWSPDGVWLCYERDDENNYTQIWRVPASGGVEQQLTFDNADHYMPSYLSVNEIVFTLSPDSGYDQIAKLNLLTLQVAVLSQFQTDHDRPSPSWNGLAVAAEALDDSGNTQIVRIAGSGGSETWLTTGTSDIMEPDYGQDNQSIFAVRWAGIPSQIVWVDAVNGGYTAVTDSLAIRDNPDAYVDSLVSTMAVYEREAWMPGGLFLGGGGRRKHGSGVYLSKFRKKPHTLEGAQGASIDIFSLDNAKPNPASHRATIRWQVPVEADVSLCVYNTAGQLVKVLADGKCKPGVYTSVWNRTDAKGRRLANGVYFYALDNGTKRISRKVILTE